MPKFDKLQAHFTYHIYRMYASESNRTAGYTSDYHKSLFQVILCVFVFMRRRISMDDLYAVFI